MFTKWTAWILGCGKPNGVDCFFVNRRISELLSLHSIEFRFCSASVKLRGFPQSKCVWHFYASPPANWGLLVCATDVVLFFFGGGFVGKDGVYGTQTVVARIFFIRDIGYMYNQSIRCGWAKRLWAGGPGPANTTTTRLQRNHIIQTPAEYLLNYYSKQKIKHVFSILRTPGCRLPHSVGHSIYEFLLWWTTVSRILCRHGDKVSR